MHPVFSSARYLIAVAGLWAALSFIISYFLHLISSVEASKAIILFTPPLFLYFFFCIANYSICQRLPIRISSFLQLLTTQLVGMLATLMIWLTTCFAYAYFLQRITEFDYPSLFLDSSVFVFIVGAILYCFWILVHYIYLMAEAQDELLRSELQRKLLISQTELQAIRATVHPHFLFNSLNTLSALALSNPEKVHQISLKLAEFLRYSVSYSRKEIATVGDELEHIQNYLAIERERFGKRLETEIEVDDIVLSIPILPLLLFPLVENSIKHGIDNRLDGGLIKITIKLNNNMLNILIENPYNPTQANTIGEHFGLNSVRKRLQAHYGEAARFITSKDMHRFVIHLNIPVENKANANSSK